MHFVKKVASTEEQIAKKEKERGKKLAIFCSARDKLLAKREKGEYDEELLEISEKLLEKNPDVYTFWNIRRRAIIFIFENQLKNPNFEIGKDNNAEKLTESLFANELRLTEACLRENPKSYSSWFHRCWVLKRMPHPDYNEEIAMCNCVLKLDDRNFHCWDHRRAVCILANISAHDELRFCDEKLNANFSNYSAWHYRSSLLPITDFDTQGKMPMSAHKLAQEMNLVTNAFYTDPEDQSAWFYTSWLFDGDSNNNGAILEAVLMVILNLLINAIFIPHLSLADPVLISATIDQSKTRLILVMSKSINRKSIINYITLVDVPNGDWKSGEIHAKKSKIWIFYSKDAINCAIKIVSQSKNGQDIFVPNESFIRIDEIRKILKPNELIEPLRISLEKMLANCAELSKMESENKWPKLILALCMKRLNAEKYHQEIVDIFEKLPKIDTKRSQMYEDLGTFVKTDHSLLDIVRNSSLPVEIRLENLGLFHLNGHFELFAGFLTYLNLSSNKLKSLQSLKNCLKLKRLIVDENEIADLNGITDLLNLDFLSIARNKIQKADIFHHAKNSNLKLLLFCENPICHRKSELEKVTEMLENVRLIPFYLF